MQLLRRHEAERPWVRAVHVIIPLVMLAVMVGCRDAASPRQGRAAVALLRVHSQTPTILGDSEPLDAREQQAFRHTQAALLKSPFVLEAALRHQQIAELPVIAGADDAIQWVRERLEVAFPGNGEIMEVRLFDETLADEQLTTLTDAICEAYLRDVVDGERVEMLRLKEVLSEQLAVYREDLSRKRAEHAKLAAALATSRTDEELLRMRYRDLLAERRGLSRKTADAALAYQLQLIDLNAAPTRSTLRVSAARPVLPEPSTPEASLAADTEDPAPADDEGDAEDEDAASASGAPATEAARSVEPGRDQRESPAPWHPAAKAHDRYRATRRNLQEQIEALDTEIDRVKEQLVSRSDPAAALAPLEEEIRRYERLVQEMGDKSLRWDVELAAPSRVRMIQPAVVQRVTRQAGRDRSGADSY